MSDLESRGPWVQTFSGRKFYPLSPLASEVFIADIAHALSMQCRFTGHCREFYSVAEHCCRVADLVPDRFRLHALLHDAPEAYLGDFNRPMKRHSELGRHYRDVEHAIWLQVVWAFNLFDGVEHSLEESHAAVEAADVTLLVTEARDLMGPLCTGWSHSAANGYAALPGRIEPWTQAEAKRRFLERFELLWLTRPHLVSEREGVVDVRD